MFPLLFRAKVWKYSGASAWYFVTLPRRLSLQLRLMMFSEEEGWGRLGVRAEVGGSKWKTAIWYDTKARAYLLPIKKSVRVREGIEAGSRCLITLDSSWEDSPEGR